jgi:hypothetical protein
MNQTVYALCVKFADVNVAQIISASRKHKVAVLHVENYNSTKDYHHIFDEYPLEIPQHSILVLLFIFPDGNSFIAERGAITKEIDRINAFMLNA